MNSISLIGMPGAGKSTLGVILAKNLAKDFVDTDVLIQNRIGETLQSFIDTQGYLALREIEEAVLKNLQIDNTVIATGGSAVYSDAGIRQLKKLGKIIYLKLPFERIEKRVNNFSTRGLACPPNQNLSSIYQERSPLYEKAADKIIDADTDDIELVMERITAALSDS